MKYKLSPDRDNMSPHLVVIESYDTNWPIIAAKKSLELEHIVGQNLLRVEHFGSTSIPGMAAKPVIDLMPIVRTWMNLKNTNC